MPVKDAQQPRVQREISLSVKPDNSGMSLQNSIKIRTDIPEVTVLNTKRGKVTLGGNFVPTQESGGVADSVKPTNQTFEITDLAPLRGQGFITEGNGNRARTDHTCEATCKQTCPSCRNACG